MAVQPIFLFSLPRAGSTLVQRVIAAHDDVHTVSEPWLLLPLFYGLRTDGARADYWHEAGAEALCDFCDLLPGGRDDYRDAVRDLALDLYDRASPDGARYFLDKTPHYHAIAEEVIRAFPDGKFVFLWRNPLAALASLIDTFRDGRWQPGYFRWDLEHGIHALAHAWRANAGRSCAVRYEDLLAPGGEAEWRRVFAYLDLGFDAEVLTSFTDVQLNGRYGDPTGIRRYSALSSEPLQKWRTTVAGPVRTAWARAYLRRMAGPLAVMGYDAGELAESLVPHSVRSAATDAIDMGIAAAGQAVRNRSLRISETARPIGDGFRAPQPLARRVAGRAKRAVVGGPQA